MDLARKYVPERGDEGQDLEIELIVLERARRCDPPRPANAVRPVELDELAIGLGRDRRQARHLTHGGRWRRRARSARCDRRGLARMIARPAVPVWVAQIRTVAPSALELTSGVHRNALRVDAQGDRLGDEGRLAPFWCRPACDGVMLWQVQPGGRVAEGG